MMLELNDHWLVAGVSAFGAITAGYLSSRAAFRKIKQDTIMAVRQLEAQEREAYRREQREELLLLRGRVRSVETDLSDCLRKHTLAEMALIRAGIGIEPEQKP